MEDGGSLSAGLRRGPDVRNRRREGPGSDGGGSLPTVEAGITFWLRSSVISVGAAVAESSRPRARRGSSRVWL